MFFYITALSRLVDLFEIYTLFIKDVSKIDWKTSILILHLCILTDVSKIK